MRGPPRLHGLSVAGSGDVRRAKGNGKNQKSIGCRRAREFGQGGGVGAPRPGSRQITKIGGSKRRAGNLGDENGQPLPPSIPELRKGIPDSGGTSMVPCLVG